MPLYEYECDACGHRFEFIHQKFSDPPVEKCPKCGGPVHKMISSPAFHLKGTGWYATDYAKKDQPGGGTKTEGKGGSEKADKAAEKSEKDKSEKSDKSEKTEKSERSDKSEKSEKSEKADTSGKSTEKTAASPPSTPKKD